MKKQCSICKLEKDSSDFYKDKRIKSKSKLYSCCRQCNRKYYKKELVRIYQVKNRDKYKEYLKKSQKKRWKIDINYRLHKNISCQLRHWIKNNKQNKRTESLIGYSIKALIEHLEKHFDEKMSWDNYGSYWVIDHIKPQSLFEYKNLEDENIKKCWALENLQPMEKIANIKKSNHF